MKTFSRLPLNLAPIPAERSANASDNFSPPIESFVDEDVVASIIALPKPARVSASPSDLALSADESDFVGWPAATSPRIAETASTSAAEEDAPIPSPSFSAGKPALNKPRRRGFSWKPVAVILGTALVAGSLVFAHLADRSSAPEALETIKSALGISAR